MDREAFRARIARYKLAKLDNPYMSFWEWKEHLRQADAMPSSATPDTPNTGSEQIPIIRTYGDGDPYGRQPLDSPWEDPRFYINNKPNFELRKEPQHYHNPTNLKIMRGVGRVLKGASLAGEVVLNLFPSEDLEIYEKARQLMQHTNNVLLGKDIPRYEDGTDSISRWSSLSSTSRLKYYEEINPALGFDPLSFFGAFLTRSGLATRAKAPKEDEARWAAYLGLEYDKQYAPDTKIRFAGDEDYPNRLYQGLSKDAKDEIRNKIIPEAIFRNQKYPGEWLQVTDEPLRTVLNDKVIEHSRLNHLGDLGKFGIRENNNSGIYEIGDKYDFPWWVPIPDRTEGYELMIRDTIWSDRAKPELYIPRTRNNKKSN